MDFGNHLRLHTSKAAKQSMLIYDREHNPLVVYNPTERHGLEFNYVRPNPTIGGKH